MQYSAQDLCHLLYECVAEEARWPVFFSTLCEAMGADAGAVLFVHNYDSHSLDFVYTQGLTQEQTELYRRRYALKDPLLARLRNAKPGFVYSTETLLPAKGLMKTQFYNEFLAPSGVRHCLGAVLIQDGSLTSQIGLLRSARSKPFGDKEFNLLTELVPHLERAARLNRRLAVAEQDRAAWDSVLNALPVGLVLVDSSSRPVTTNALGKEILRARDGLQSGHDGRLGCSLQKDGRKLAAMIRAAAAPGGQELLSASGVMIVNRPSGKGLYLLMISPLPSPFGARSSQRATVAIFISDPLMTIAQNSDALKGLFGFSSAEIRLAVFLMEGKSLIDAAKSLQISHNTARNQLRSMFAKTNTSRQVELVRLLLQTPAVLRQPV